MKGFNYAHKPNNYFAECNKFTNEKRALKRKKITLHLRSCFLNRRIE
jgi:hypothetical protein